MKNNTGDELLPERYSVTDNGDYEWIIDNQTGEEVSPRFIAEILNRTPAPSADLSRPRLTDEEVGGLKAPESTEGGAFSEGHCCGWNDCIDMLRKEGII